MGLFYLWDRVSYNVYGFVGGSMGDYPTNFGFRHKDFVYSRLFGRLYGIDWTIDMPLFII